MNRLGDVLHQVLARPMATWCRCGLALGPFDGDTCLRCRRGHPGASPKLAGDESAAPRREGAR